MTYGNERPIEMTKKSNYFSFPGLMDKDFLIVGKNQKLDVNQIINKILAFYNYSLDILRIASRKKEKVRAKHICYYLLTKYFDYSTTQIGVIFNVDHTTVLHGTKQVQAQLSIHNHVYSSEIKHILSTFNK